MCCILVIRLSAWRVGDGVVGSILVGEFVLFSSFSRGFSFGFIRFFGVGVL